MQSDQLCSISAGMTSATSLSLSIYNLLLYGTYIQCCLCSAGAELEVNALNRRIQGLEEDLEKSEDKLLIASQKLDKVGHKVISYI